MMSRGVTKRWGRSKCVRPDSVELQDVREHVVLYIDKSMYPEGAQYIESFHKTDLVASSMSKLLQLFCAVLYNMNQVQLFNLGSGVKPRHGTKRRKPNDAEKTKNLSMYTSGNIRAYIETIYDTSTNDMVGYRFHVMTLGDSENKFAESLLNVIRYNAELAQKLLDGTKVPKAGPYDSYRSIDSVAKYAQLCDLYVGSNTCKENPHAVEDFINDITTEVNPANPLKVFSLSNAFEKLALRAVVSKKRGKAEVTIDPAQLEETAYYPDGDLRCGRIRQPRVCLPPTSAAAEDSEDADAAADAAAEDSEDAAAEDSAAAKAGAAAAEDVPGPPLNRITVVDTINFSAMSLFPKYIPFYQFLDIDRISVFLKNGFGKGLFGQGLIDAGFDPMTMAEEPSAAVVLRNCLAPTKRLRSEADTFPSRDSLLRAFLGRVWDGDAAISNSGKAIRTWYDSTEHTPVEHTLWSKKLTVFGHFVQRLYTQINHHGLVSTAHDSIFMMLTGCLDAYRSEFGLHINGLATGNSSTGKSFMFDTVKKWCIPGTISETVRKTAASDAVEPEHPGAFSDGITIFHEMPASMIKEGYRENDQAAEHKSSLTGGNVTTQYYFQDEEGNRRKRTITNDVTGTQWGATNTGMRGMGEAMRSRWLHMPMDIKTNADRSVSACMQAERTKTAENRLADAKFAYSCHWRQCLVWMVEKMIHGGDGRLLPPVNMTAANHVFEQIQRGLKRERGKTGKRIHARNMERCRIYARLFTIFTAIDRTFCIPGAMHRGKSPVEPKHLLDLAPWLVCTEEIAVFTFTMLRGQFFDQNAPKLIKHIEKIWTDSGGEFRPTGRSLAQFNGNQALSATDYNYVCLPMKRLDLARQINVQMDASSGKVSIEDIDTILKRLEEESFMSRPWGQYEQLEEPERVFRRAQYDNSGKSGKCYVLRSLFGNSGEEGALMRVLDHATHAHTVPQRILTALGGGVELETIEWLPRSGVVLRLENMNHASGVESRILGYSTGGSRVASVDDSFEVLAFKEHGSELPPRVRPTPRSATP